MIIDFIIANKLKSKLLNFPPIISMEKLILSKRIPPSKAVKLQLFNTKKDSPFICVTPFQSELNVKKIGELIEDNNFIEMDENESIEYCGYKKDCIPLISIYGAKFIIDKSLENKESLFCKVSDKNILDAVMEEILNTNDDVVFEDIVLK
ncbi:MAG: YbaK/EbsC family protein [archaeon]|jgi:prolyl-tRNA editing enzyme YbaK/EbsC (Cys-tRNA(Pro) deacylase)